VRRAGNRVRVAAQLLNAANGTAVWAQTMDRELKDVFTVQDEIASAVASAVQRTVVPAAGN
jgi:adenylate cyclase